MYADRSNFSVGGGPQSISIVSDAQLHYSALSESMAFGRPLSPTCCGSVLPPEVSWLSKGNGLPRSIYVGARARALQLSAAVGTPPMDGPSEKDIDVAGCGRRYVIFS